jgi:DNA-binding LacI/PurR family transcriptional regulator
MGKKIKHKDLAARLGLSRTLISLVLNNKADKHGIRKDTQEKVLTLARQMGYFENLHESNSTSPVEEKPGVIGMFVHSINDPYVNQIAPYLHKTLSSIGVGFTLITADSDDQRYIRMISAFKKFLSGLILFGDAADELTIKILRSTNYPFIILECPDKNLKINSVSSDNSAGADLVINHIDKLGYKNILIIIEKKSIKTDTSAIKAVINTINRKPGLRDPVIAEFDNLITNAELDFEQIGKYLRPPFRADVMIIMTAGLVYPVMAMLNQKVIRVPQDIAVISMEEGIGFDLMFSPVTSLRKPLSDMADKLANILWSEIRNSGKGKLIRQEYFAPELIIRKSCGTVKL